MVILLPFLGINKLFKLVDIAFLGLVYRVVKLSSFFSVLNGSKMFGLVKKKC